MKKLKENPALQIAAKNMLKSFEENNAAKNV